MSGEGSNRATDAQSHVEGRLELVLGQDGGVSAVTLELTNTSTGDDVVLKVNSALSAFMTLTATDAQGQVLSKPGRKFSSAEQQAFELVRLGPSEARRWRVPLGDQLAASALPAEGVQGRLVLNVLLLFQTLRHGTSAGQGDG